MISGPILPLTRDGLWRLVRQRSDLLERGLRVVAESLEFGAPDAGLVDGLLRDASGTAVLLFATDERDRALPARVLTAHAFWRRNAAGMVRALPEADLRTVDRCRLVVVGAAIPAEVVATLERLQLPDLEVVAIETFQVAGQERLVLRPLRGQLALSASPPVDAQVDAPARMLIEAFVDIARAIDPKVRIEGDRFSRRALLDGRLLGECWFAEGRVFGGVDGGAGRWLQTLGELRVLGDQLARRYLAAIGTAGPAPVSSVPAVRDVAAASARSGFDALRASVSASRLSREECAALGEVADVGESEEATLADG